MGHLIAFLLIGLIAGWLAGQLMKGKGFGTAGNLLVGVLGSLFGGFLFNLVGLYAYGFVGSLVMSVVGALILLSLLNMMKHRL